MYVSLDHIYTCKICQCLYILAHLKKEIITPTYFCLFLRFNIHDGNYLPEHTPCHQIADLYTEFIVFEHIERTLHNNLIAI